MPRAKKPPTDPRQGAHRSSPSLSVQGPDIGVLAERLRDAIAGCSSEEDLRVSVELVLREALPELPVPRYEKAVRTSTFTGRADAVHQRLVIEYEKPRSLMNSTKHQHAVQQVCDYITGFRLGPDVPTQVAEPGLFPPGTIYTREEEERLAANVGLVTDGQVFTFVHRRGKNWFTERRTLDADTAEKLLLWLRAMSRKDLSPENLIADFGPSSPLAAAVVSVLAKLVESGRYPKANVIFEEWKRIFGIVYGTEQLHRTRRDPESEALIAAYQLDIGVDFSLLLFSIHTYYALLMKLLATEVIVGQGGLGDTFIGRLARGRLQEQLRQMESGEILQQHNIRNAIEEDFFGWYPEAWTPELHDVLWGFAQSLRAYDIGTFELKPDRARDLLKDLYHGLIPEAVRHALGEYYTPDWLAEHTLALAGYDGDPHRAFLDPSCGSGTFLVLAIHRVRQWLTDRTVEWGGSAKQLEAVKLIRRNVVGFDLNPLAVIASRTNYLFALGPLLRFREKGPEFEIPVYLTDSVLLPVRTGEQKQLFAQETVAFPMTVATFNVPLEVVERRQVRELMNLLHDCIVEDHDCDSFIGRSIAQLGLPPHPELQDALHTLFDTMKALDRQGKNRVWAKLIRNRYASLFFRDYFDFVVGNPPHVNWESLTPEWRKAAEQAYKRYGLFTLKGLESRHGGGKKDIAALFTYAVMDHFVKHGGVLSLVVHVSLFKTSGAGEGYRRFQLGAEESFRVEEAHDFRSFQPFQTDSAMRIKTRTLTFRAIKGEKTSYPVPYHVWSKTVKGVIPGGSTWAEARERLTSVELVATPLRGTSEQGYLSPWLTVSKKALPQCKKVIAPVNHKSHYEGHAGIYTGGLNGAYFLEVLERYPNGTVRVRNRHDVGKIACPKVEATLEADLVHPLLRGRSVARWRYSPEGHVLIVQDPKTQRGFPEKWLQKTHPLAWAYLKKFEKLLRERKAFQKFFDPDKDPFYSMYAIGEYTMAPNKVVWMDVSATMKATVVSAESTEELPIPEHKLLLLATATANEAHYVAAVLNSDPVGTVITGYIVDNSVSTHPIDNIAIPRFDENDVIHANLAALSREAHVAAAKGDSQRVARAESAINKTVGRLW